METAKNVLTVNSESGEFDMRQCEFRFLAHYQKNTETLKIHVNVFSTRKNRIYCAF